MSERVVEELLERVHSGDQSAATELYQRYVDRLVGLARSRLSPSFARRVDPEDVVQSACRSFFCRVIDGRYREVKEEQLWHLLAAIVVNKARKAVRRHMSKKRSVIGEESTARLLAVVQVSPVAVAQEPSPEDAAILIEETEVMMGSLTTLQRQIVQMHLQGYATLEIAGEVGCSERTVQRAIEHARIQLQTTLGIGSLDY